jgi:hypothetical protein
MNEVLAERLGSLVFGEPQQVGAVTVVPILQNGAGTGPALLTLREALEKKLLTVTEVSEGGSVPHLRVVNGADLPVLLLDGEELLGAKQNRVVNTTILLKEKSETVIPVSCVEAHRWHYHTRAFTDSDAVMSRRARGSKSRSVHQSLRARGVYASDQGKVWDEVATLHEDLGTRSETGAMHDAYRAYEGRLKQWRDAVRVREGQVGFVFLHKGVVLGLEFLASPKCYAPVHDRLMKSYTIDMDPEEDTPGESPDPAEVVAAFLSSIRALPEEAYPSCGYGTDYRYEQETLSGAALVHEDACVHTVFFRDEDRRRPRSRIVIEDR